MPLDARGEVASHDNDEQLLYDDFSRGAELRPIPVYGRPDDAASIPEGFQYVRTSWLQTAAARQCAASSQAAWHWAGGCGVQAMGGAFVKPSGRLYRTRDAGLFECGPACKAPECVASRLLSGGIQLPLEVFATPLCGWGVRCREPIAAGSFMCEYAGAVCTSTEAEAQPQAYAFALDHFLLLKARLQGSGRDQREAQPLLPGQQEAASHLVVDASSSGNVGRFINHSCDGNVLVQPVLVPGSSSLFYKIGLFAKRDVPAFEELAYDYGWLPVSCLCGSRNCRGRL